MNFDRFWARYEAGEWEPDTHELLTQILKPGDLFVDIGAWIGPVTLWALELGAHVIAIEPDPIALDELRRRAPEAEVWAGAVVADDITTARLTSRPSAGMSRLTAKGHSVAAWSLRRILDQRVPRLVTMDVEGYEMALLPTVAPFLADLGVPLQVELHDRVPKWSWFAGYSDVRMPRSARNERRRPNRLVALP